MIWENVAKNSSGGGRLQWSITKAKNSKPSINESKIVDGKKYYVAVDGRQFEAVPFEKQYGAVRIIFHVRVEQTKHTKECYSFYNVEAPNKKEAADKARKQFSEDFGYEYADTKAAYIWDAGVHVDLKSLPAI